eukprot:s497_g26.t1
MEPTRRPSVEVQISLPQLHCFTGPRGSYRFSGPALQRRAAMASVEAAQFSDDGDLDACAEALDQQRKQFEIEGKYEDAEQVKMRLDLLQEKADAKRKEALRQRQLAQRLGVEEAHMKELQEFNQHWDQKVAEFEAHAASLQAQLQERHNQEFAEARKKFEMETEPRNPRFSKDLLNLRKIQDTLAKMKKYSEAGKTKQQADILEAKEREAWSTKREAKIRSLEEQFLHKQSLEMTGLTKRIVSGREEPSGARGGGRSLVQCVSLFLASTSTWVFEEDRSCWIS